MYFTSLLFKNLWRHRTRTLLTVLGISIGVGTIVTFGLAISGLEDTVTGMMKPSGADFSVAKAGAADIVLSFLSVEQLEKIENTDGVERAAPFAFGMAAVENNPYFIIGGMRSEDPDMAGVKLTEGRKYESEDEIVLGKIAAKNKDVKVGSKVTLNQKEYSVAGIFESGVSFQDGGAMASLSEVQRIQNVSDKVTMVFVKAKEGEDAKAVAERVEAADSDLASIMDISDYESVDTGWAVLDAITWAISLLAVVIGGIGVMNTIIMSVFERTKEIGVLRALGWSRGRIVGMILGESLFVGVLAAVIGTGLGLALIWGVLQTDMGKAWLVVQYDSAVFIRALIVALGVVLIGALYPAYKASRLQPTEALRYE